MTDKAATQAEIAEHLDMSTRNLREILRVLKIDWRETSLDEIRIAYIQKMREAAAGRSDDNLAQARFRREMADARLKEFEFAKKEKMIVVVDDVGPLLVSLLKELQVSILEAGNKALQAIENDHGITVDDDLLHRHLRAALRDVAASGDQLVASIAGQPCTSVSKGTESSDGLDQRESQATA